MVATTTAGSAASILGAAANSSIGFDDGVVVRPRGSQHIGPQYCSGCVPRFNGSCGPQAGPDDSYDFG
jgi:hypothetical protein